MAKKRPRPRTLETTYRTYRLDEPTRAGMKRKRKREAQTVAAFLESAIKKQLPQIIGELNAVGVPASLEEGARPARLPLTDELVERLRKGSDKTGVPTTRLLVACIQREVKGKSASSKKGE